MAAYTTRMPAGIPGALTRAEGQATIEPGIFNSAAPVTAYGVPVKLVNGKVQPLAAAADAVYGILVRPFPITGANANDPLGVAVPPTSGVCDVLRRGYIAVKNTAGVPAKGAQVYIDATTFAITATAASNTALAGAKFTGAADSAGNVEIEFNI